MSDVEPIAALTPEDYRRRYLALKARALAGVRRVDAGERRNPKVLPAELIVHEEVIPGGWYWTCRIARGESLRLVNDEAGAGISALFWNADDTSERLNPADSIKVQWSARLARGKLLLSDMGRVLASITDDTCGFHDFVAGGSTRASDERKFGADPVRRNTRDNFVLAASKHGLGSRDVGPCVSFFTPVVTNESGAFFWRSDAVKPGDYVDLRAEMDLLVALSNCPHPLAPGTVWQAPPIRAILWRSPSAGADDQCRTGTDEAVRAFENTDTMNRA